MKRIKAYFRKLYSGRDHIAHATIGTLLLCLCSCAAPRHFASVNTASVHRNINENRASIAQASGLAVGVKKEIAIAKSLAGENLALASHLDAANGQVDMLTAALIRAGASATAAEDQLKIKDGEMQKVVDNANLLAQQSQKNDAIVKRVDAYWGIGAILYGFERLLKHLLILAAVLIGVAALLWVASIFFPFLAPVGALFNGLWLRVAALLKPKPK